MVFKHLEEYNISYTQHAWRSMGLAVRLWRGAVLATIHAIYPDWFTTASTDLTSDLVKQLFNELANRTTA